MRRLCLVGDSHLGVIKHAMATLAPQAGITATYFGAHADLWGGVGVRGRTLAGDDKQLKRFFARGSGGQTVLNVDDYDAFVIVGLRFSIWPFVNLSQHHASESMAAGDKERRRLSDACFEAAGHGALMDGLAANISRQLRSLTDRPIVILPVPNPSAGVPAAILPSWLALYYGVSRPEEGWTIRAHFEAAGKRVGKALDAEVIPLPQQAAATGLLNRMEYSLLPPDITAMEASEVRNKMTHGNDRYAELVLPSVLAATKLNLQPAAAA